MQKKRVYIYVCGRGVGGVQVDPGTRPVAAGPATREGSDRLFQDPWFALALAAFRRRVVHMQAIEKEDLIRL